MGETVSISFLPPAISATLSLHMRAALPDVHHFVVEFCRQAFQAVCYDLAVPGPDKCGSVGDYQAVAAFPECGSLLQRAVCVCQELLLVRPREGSVVRERADQPRAGPHLNAVFSGELFPTFKSFERGGDRGGIVQGAEWVEADVEARVPEFAAYPVGKTAAEYHYPVAQYQVSLA